MLSVQNTLYNRTQSRKIQEIAEWFGIEFMIGIDWLQSLRLRSVLFPSDLPSFICLASQIRKQSGRDQAAKDSISFGLIYLTVMNFYLGQGFEYN